LIKRIGALDVAGRVGIPHREFATAAIEVSGAFAEAVEVFVETEALKDCDAFGLRIAGHGALVGIDDAASLAVDEADKQGVFVDAHFELVAHQADRGSILGDLRRDGWPFRAVDRPRVIRVGVLVRENGKDAHQILREKTYLNRRAIGAADLESALHRLHRGCAPNGQKTLRLDPNEAQGQTQEHYTQTGKFSHQRHKRGGLMRDG